MMLHDKDVQKKPEQRARESERQERKQTQKKVDENYYRDRSEISVVVSTRPGLSRGNAVLVKTIAETMYTPGSDHMKRRIRSGKPLNAHSMAEGRAVMRSIVNQWGERSIALLKVEEILMYVSGLERSGSYKRNFMCKVKELYREACWYGCNIPVPSFPSFKKNTRKADIFTEDELRSYFNPELYADQNLYLFYLCCLTAALRPGEARGLRPKQILFDKKALVVDGFVKKNGVRTGYDEKRTGDYTKLRIVPLPDLALRLLKEHIDRKGLQTGDFCFTAKKDPSRPIPESSIRDTMARIIKKTGIQTRGRKLAINSFRYTYATYMLRELPAGTVMKLVGHRMTGITEYYRKRGIDESLAGLTGAEKAVEKLLT